MTDWKAVPTFGLPDPRFPKVSRPSAYALVVNPSGCLAVVRTSTGTYLPGGGSLGTESPEATVRREVGEECGLTIRPDAWRRDAVDHVTAANEGTHFEKRSTFLGAVLVDSSGAPTEPDHTTLWLAPHDALAALTPPSHRWAVMEWMPHGNDAAMT